MSISFGQQLPQQCRSIVRGFEIAIQRMKKPERRVGGVIQALVLAFREHVGNQAVANVVGERAQNIAGFDVAAGRQRQPFQTDHRVAAPIGEPVISGNDGANFVAGGAARAPHPLRPAGVNDKLVGRPDQLAAGLIERSLRD